MKENLVAVVIVLAGLVFGSVLLAWWLNLDASAGFEKRLARPDELSQSPFAPTAGAEVIRIGEHFKKFDGVPSGIKGAWPCFRGSNHDNISVENVKLAGTWPADGPPVLWSVELGEGYAGPAIMNGRVYLLDYDGKEQADSLRCFSLDDGREIWRRWYKVRMKRNHGMSRTVPAVTDRHVVTMGPRCHVMCVDSATGDLKWGIDLEKNWGVKVPMWYTGQCPLIDNEQAILGVGGKALIMGVDCATGQVAWQTPNPNGWQMSHSSIMPMTINGKRMYVYCALGGMVGVSAEEKDRGAVLWETTEWRHQVISPSPVPVGDGRILVTAGYGEGSAMFKVMEEGGKYAVKQLYRLDKKIFACEQHTPVFYKDHFYSILPADAGPVKKELVCMNLDGKVIWSSGSAERFGLGPFMIADDKLLILEDNGLLVMAKATDKAYTRLTHARVLSGKEAWAPMALVNGRLLVRDYGKMNCLEVGAR
jgi:outer membrane protein assembly factor BamB